MEVNCRQRPQTLPSSPFKPSDKRHRCSTERMRRCLFLCFNAFNLLSWLLKHTLTLQSNATLAENQIYQLQKMSLLKLCNPNARSVKTQIYHTTAESLVINNTCIGKQTHKPNRETRKTKCLAGNRVDLTCIRPAKSHVLVLLVLDGQCW